MNYHLSGSDELKVGLVGCGGRGSGAVNDCLHAPGVKLVAMADVFEDRLQASLNHLTREAAERIDVPRERRFVGFDAYKKLLECDLDLVLLATPPGFRPLHYEAAISSGKHVFMEKPCCVDAPGYRLLMKMNKAADEKGLKVAVGLQRRHSREYLDKVKKMQEGSLGEIQLMRCYWNGGFNGQGFSPTAEKKSEMDFQLRNWNNFLWLSGDHIVEQHVHNIDVCNWVKNAHPVAAQGCGDRQRRKYAQIFDHHFVQFTYEDESIMFSQCRQMPSCWEQVTQWFHGTKKTEELPGNGSDGYVQEHLDLIQAIREGKKLNDGWHGATSSMTAVLGRMATYSGRRIEWDEAVEKGPAEVPAEVGWNTPLPAMPDSEGSYKIPVPGRSNPFRS